MCIVEPPVQLHLVIIGIRVLYRRDSDRTHRVERLIELRYLEIETGFRFGAERNLGCRVPQRARRMTGSVALDPAARRILRGGADAGSPECRRRQARR